MESLALSLLPVFATALDLDENFFEEAFKSPMFRLRLSHYPPASTDTDQYGQSCEMSQIGQINLCKFFGGLG